MASYDANILNKEANRYIGRANSIVALYGLAGFFLGLVGGGGAGAGSSKVARDMEFVAGGIVFVVIWLIFIAIGYEKSWSLRVQAHRLLWLVDVQSRVMNIEATLLAAPRHQVPPPPPPPAASRGHRPVRSTPPVGHTAVDVDSRHR